MWDKNAPLELLADAEINAEPENLRKIQQIIDMDKYNNSVRLNCDLCGGYASFCDICDKTGDYPCAYSFIKSKQSETPSAEEPVAVVQPVRKIRIAVAKRKH